MSQGEIPSSKRPSEQFKILDLAKIEERVRQNQKPLHVALALAYFTDEQHFVVMKRSGEALDYKNKWSLPTISLSLEDLYDLYKNNFVLPAYIIERFIEGKRLPLDMKDIEGVEIFVHRSGLRDRGEKFLLMNIAIAKGSAISNIENRFGPRGQIFGTVTARQFIELSDPGVGTCGSLLIQTLMENCQIPFTEWYLEIPPELSDMDSVQIKELGNDSLWKLSSSNYDLYRSGLAGSVGYLALSKLVDHHLKQLLNKYKSEASNSISILDIGGGQHSQIAKWCRAQEIDATSIDIVNSKFNTDDISCNINDINERSKLINKYSSCIDVILMTNLIQWLEDPSDSLMFIRELMKPAAKLLISLPMPEFYRTGEWIGHPTEGKWVINKPISGHAELDMISHSVGPLILYRRSTADYVKILFESGFRVIAIDNLPPGNGSYPIVEGDEWISRHRYVPAFSIFEVEKM